MGRPTPAFCAARFGPDLTRLSLTSSGSKVFSPTQLFFLQRCESSGNRFIECFRSDIDGMLHFLNVPERNCARSQDHEAGLHIRFVFAIYRCSDSQKKMFFPSSGVLRGRVIRCFPPSRSVVALFSLKVLPVL